MSICTFSRSLRGRAVRKGAFVLRLRGGLLPFEDVADDAVGGASPIILCNPLSAFVYQYGNKITINKRRMCMCISHQISGIYFLDTYNGLKMKLRGRRHGYWPLICHSKLNL